jgi:carboxymethylenebutenolidase
MKEDTTTIGDAAIGLYLVQPVGPARGAIVVLQELFGVNAHIKQVCQQYADEGYLSLAPALFDRAEKGVELGYTKADVERGLALRNQIPMAAVLADVQAAINCGRKAGNVAVVGYCWGGTLAFLSSTRLTGLECAIGYYGSMIPDFADEIARVPLMLHFGRTDHTLPPEKVARVMQAQPQAEIFEYDAGHGFNCDERPSYDKTSAELAFRRTVSLAREALEAPSR